MRRIEKQQNEKAFLMQGAEKERKNSSKFRKMKTFVLANNWVEVDLQYQVSNINTAGERVDAQRDMAFSRHTPYLFALSTLCSLLDTLARIITNTYTSNQKRYKRYKVYKLYEVP